VTINGGPVEKTRFLALPRHAAVDVKVAIGHPGPVLDRSGPGSTALLMSRQPARTANDFWPVTRIVPAQWALDGCPHVNFRTYLDVIESPLP